MKRHLPTPLTVILVVAAALLTGCDTPEPTTVAPVIRPVVVETVSATSASDLSFNGTVRPLNRADLSFTAGGTLTELAVKQGDKVSKGQRLAAIDDRAQTTALASAQAEYAKAKADYERGQSIFSKSQAISKADLEQLRTKFNVQASRLADAQRAKADTVLVAPFPGQVTRTPVDQHALVQPNQTVISLQDSSALEVVIEVPARYVIGGARKETALGESASFPGVLFPLQLKSYSTEINSKTQSYEVVFLISDTLGKGLLPGAPITVLGEPGSEGAQLSLPLTAVLSDNQGGNFVFKVGSDGKVSQQAVTVGELAGERVAISSGIVPGDQIVVAGVNSVSAGMTVRAISAGDL